MAHIKAFIRRSVLLSLLAAGAWVTATTPLDAVVWNVSRPIAARAQQSPAKLRIPVYGLVVEGTVAPSQLVTVTATSPTGVLKGTAPATARSDNGRYLAGIMVPIEPGDVVQLDAYMGGDPIIAVVPKITAETARDGSEVSGIAPQTARVEVFDHDKASMGDVIRGADGGYSISAVGHPGPGHIVVTSVSGVEFYLAWASPTFDLVVSGYRRLLVSGPSGRRVDVALSDAHGRPVARYAATPWAARVDSLLYPVSTQFYFTDDTGVLIALSEGDTLDVVVGDDKRTLTVPPMEAVFHRADKLVAGRTLPDIDLSIGVNKVHPGTVQSGAFVDTHSDSAGLFSADTSGLDVAFNDTLQLTVNPTDDLEVRNYVQLPGMTLDLNYATIEGDLPYGQEATIDVKRRNGQTFRFQVKSSGIYNNYHTDLSGILTSQPGLGEGDTIRLSTTKEGRTETTVLEVPELDFTLDAAWSEVTGKVTPGGALGLYVFRPLFRLFADGIALGGNVQIAPTLTGDFRYRMDAIEKSTKLYPGNQIQVLYKLPSGHFVRRTKHLPFANVEVGGPRLCGFAPPGHQITATVQTGTGPIVATASSRIGINSRYDMVLRAPSGEPFATVPGQTVKVDTGDELLSVDIPRMETFANWHGGQPGVGTQKTVLTGIGPPSKSVYLALPTAGCFSSVNDAPRYPNLASSLGIYPKTDQAGMWDVRFFETTTPGDGIEVAFYTNTGHRVFQHVVRPTVRAYLYSDRITGRTTPGTTMTFTLHAADGTPKAEAVSGANMDSDFVARLHASAGAPATLAPGDALTVDDSPQPIPIDPLNFDWSRGSGLVGTTTPKRAVRVELDLADRRTASFYLESGDDGRFKLTPQDLSARAGWDFGDVMTVRAIIQAAEDAEVAVEAVVRRDGGGIRRLYLPRVVGRR